MRSIILMSILAAASCCLGITREELEAYVPNIYSGDHIYSRRMDLTFSNLPPMSVFVDKNPKCTYMEKSLWGFYQQSANGTYEELLPVDLNPKGDQPEIRHVSIKDHGDHASISFLLVFDGNGSQCAKQVYHYSTNGLALARRYFGIGNFIVLNESTGTWEESPLNFWELQGTTNRMIVTGKWDRWKTDEEGRTWMIIPEHAKEASKPSKSGKGPEYKQDLETGYWWILRN